MSRHAWPVNRPRHCFVADSSGSVQFAMEVGFPWTPVDLPSSCSPFMPGMGYAGCMNRIQVSPEIHFGKPCVAGTRIPVQAVLELVREVIPFESIIRDYYPDLKMEDIQACIQYAIDVVQTEDIHVGVPS